MLIDSDYNYNVLLLTRIIADAVNATDYDEITTRCFDENDIFGMASTTEEAFKDSPKYARRLDSYQPDHIFLGG